MEYYQTGMWSRTLVGSAKILLIAEAPQNTAILRETFPVLRRRCWRFLLKVKAMKNIMIPYHWYQTNMLLSINLFELKSNRIIETFNSDYT